MHYVKFILHYILSCQPSHDEMRDPAVSFWKISAFPKVPSHHKEVAKVCSLRISVQL